MPVSKSSYGDRFNDAGFETRSLLFLGADIFFLFMVTMITMGVYLLVGRIIGKYSPKV
jgi:hypothetical protein